MKKWRNKILSAVLVLSLLLTSSSFAFAVGEEGTTEEPVQEVKITRDEIASLTPSSQESEQADSTIDNAFDGDKTGNSDDTIWHTSWTAENDTSGATGFPRSVKIELNEAQWISKMIYYPRNGNGTNGRFRVCKVYVSEDGKNWGEPIITSSIWENNTSSNTLELTSPKYTKYILIYGDETYGNSGNTAVNSYASAAEIELYKDMSKYPTITEQPQSAVYGPDAEIKELTVSAKAADGSDDVSYQWHEMVMGENGEYIDTEIVGDTSLTCTPTVEIGIPKYYYVVVTDNKTHATVHSDIVTVAQHAGTEMVAIAGGKFYNTFTDAVNGAYAGGTVWVLKDFTLINNVNISKELTIRTIESAVEPVTITRENNFNGIMFTVATTGNLTLDDIIIDGGAEWGNSTPAEGATNSSERNGSSIVRVNGNGQLTIGSNAILQNNESVSSGGGAIIADSGSGILNIYGKILNNKTINNTYCNGGGIVTNGKLSIYEGAFIKGNYAALGGDDAGVGGGIQLYGNGYLSIYGGTIENNRAGRNSHNISFSNNNQMILSGNFNIENINFNNFNNPIKIVGNVDKNSVMTIITNSISDRTTFATIDEGVDVSNIINSLKISNLGDNRVIYRYGNDVKVGQAAVFTDGGLSETKTVMLNPNGNTSTTLTVETTGTDVTYKWYKCSTKDGNYAEISNADEKTLTLNSLEKGSTYYYCVIDNGDESTAEPKTSTICEVKVTDFYPCSKAIDKFKNI